MYLKRELDPLLGRHAERLARCRAGLVSRLGASPDPDLAPLFERGKMLRASLVFLACAAVGGDPDRAIAAAEAIELLHGGSLVHDDVIDEADQRRGLPAVHARVGTSAALVLGDWLLVSAFEALTEARVLHGEHTVIDAVKILGCLARECCRGQLEELQLSDRAISEEQYFAVVRGKTAAPFMAASVLGGLMGGASATQLERLREYGMSLGVAFQVFDDMLDLVGSQALSGKPVGNSLAHGRPMLPLIHLRKRNRLRARQQELIDEAIAALADFPPSVDLAILRALPIEATAWWVAPGGRER
jgi:geranylgeranyl pyrophosphate synthase